MSSYNQDHRVLSDGDKLYMILSDMSLLAASSDLKKRELMKLAAEMRRQREEGKTAQVEVEGDTDTDAEKDDQVLGPLSPSAEMGSKRWLRSAFGLIYTRINVATTPAYLAFHFLLVPAIHVAAISLFAASRKRGWYNATDVTITYVILFVTAALDVLAESIRQLLYWAMSAAGVPALCETLPQYNLLRSARRRVQAGWLRKCRRERDEGMADGDVAGSVILDVAVARAASAGGLDLATYRSFDADNWILAVELQRRCGAGSTIESSLREPFDESVVVWHVATDLCFRRSGGPPPAAAAGERGREVRARDLRLHGPPPPLPARGADDRQQAAPAHRSHGRRRAPRPAAGARRRGPAGDDRPGGRQVVGVPSHPRRVQALRRADGAAAGGDALGGDVPRLGRHALLLRRHVQGVPARQEPGRRRRVPHPRLARPLAQGHDQELGGQASDAGALTTKNAREHRPVNSEKIWFP